MKIKRINLRNEEWFNFFKEFKDMESRTLDKEMSDKVSFITFIIPEFALAYKMSMTEAYISEKIRRIRLPF